MKNSPKSHLNCIVTAQDDNDAPRTWPLRSLFPDKDHRPFRFGNATLALETDRKGVG